ncbi:hypothetical protein, partial [Klebsiella pneumoniae]|uniref:hypothetical protein n=1 Tax=Klebsiella pneumoniae TaxID=573 RepID=UPI00210CE27B
PASGEINRKLGNAAEAIARIRAQYEPAAGIQIGFTFALAFLSWFAPLTNLTELRDRVLGILLGRQRIVLRRRPPPA